MALKEVLTVTVNVRLIKHNTSPLLVIKEDLLQLMAENDFSNLAKVSLVNSPVFRLKYPIINTSQMPPSLSKVWNTCQSSTTMLICELSVINVVYSYHFHTAGS